MAENVSQINSGITARVDVSLFGILLRVVVKMLNICQVLWRFSHYV